MPLDRKFEQKLWDAFRHPIDEAFNRKTQEREKAASAMGEHDKHVLEASKALQAANASGDGQQIRAASAALEAAIKGQTAAKVVETAAIKAVEDAENESKMAVAGVNNDSVAIENIANLDNIDANVTVNSTEGASPVEQVEAQEVADVEADAIADAAEDAEKASAEPAEPIAPPKPVVVPKKVIAVRGDDRPGMKKAEPAPAGKFGDRKFGDRKPGGDRENRGDSHGPRSDSRPDGRGDRFGDRGDRPAFEDRGPRLGDAAFRAQREALESAQFALKKLAAAAHGEVLVQLLDAWQTRDAAKMPSAQDLGKQLPPTARSAWTAAITAAPSGKQADADTALLRLEMAAELPTPADQLAARRMLQLQLLTKRNDPAPAQTWTADAAKVFANGFDDGAARRVQNALKVLLKR